MPMMCFLSSAEATFQECMQQSLRSRGGHDMSAAQTEPRLELKTESLTRRDIKKSTSAEVLDNV
jgi:hypothetical protein